MGSASTLTGLLDLAGRLLTAPPGTTAMRRDLEALHELVEALVRAHAAGEQRSERLFEFLERLEKQVARGGKEQFRATALAEAQQKKIDVLMEEVRGAEAFRERQLEKLRAEAQAADHAGRLDILEQLLPVLDGLDAAIEALPSRDSLPAQTAGGRLREAWLALRGRQPRDTAIEAWLRGLALVRDRTLELLAAHEVHPIASEGQEFDPNLHVALESVPARGVTPPGRVVREIHRGYMAGDEVLRYAEVVVAK